MTLSRLPILSLVSLIVQKLDIWLAFFAAALLLMPMTSRGAEVTAISNACSDNLKQLPLGWQSGWIERDSVKIFYYGNWSSYPGKTPLIFFNGGPGGASWGLFQQWAEQPQAKGRPVIFFDQRGNGCSTHYTQTVPKNKTAALALRKWGADEIILDAEALRIKLLGVNAKWDIFGQSYGSLLVHRYVEQYPASIRKAFAHGWAPIANTDGYRKIFRQYYLQGADTFFKRHVDIAKALMQLDQVKKIKIPDEWISLFPLAEKESYLIAMVQKFISDPIYAEQEGVLPAPTEAPRLDPNRAAIEVLARFDYRIFNLNIEDPWRCQDAMTTLKKEWSGPPSLLLNTDFFQCETSFPEVENLRKLVLLADSKLDLLTPFVSSLKKHPHISFHLYSGQEDPYSPPIYYEEEVRALSGKVVFRQFKGGHFDYFQNEFWADLDRY